MNNNTNNKRKHNEISITTSPTISSTPIVHLSLAHACASVRYLIKSDAEEFGIDHLDLMEDCQSIWDGIRNMQARNILRKMKLQI